MVKFRKEDFSTFTRRTTLGEAVDTSERIFPVALGLMKELFQKGVRVRLIGVAVSNLLTNSGSGVQQLDLFRQTSQKEQKLAEAVDDIARRFGGQAITRAALISPK
jgi:hypothetical protein